MKHLLRFGTLAALLAIPALLAYAAPAKPAAAPAAVIGVCDSDKIDRDYKGYEQAQNIWSAFQEERVGAFDVLVSGQYLSPAEFDELQIFSQQKVKTDQKRYDELVANADKATKEYEALMKKVKDNLTAEERAQLEQIEGAVQYTRDMDAEKAALVDKGKAKLSAEDKARLDEMDKNHLAVVAKLTEQRDKLRKEFNVEGDRLLQVLKGQREAAIAKVAADNKLSIVLSKTVAAGQDDVQQLVLWGGTDITEAVLEYLNKNFKPESLAAPAPKK
ncbi:MAG: OmpH/Skp family outer membrane protein [Armatimonadota bacterium]